MFVMDQIIAYILKDMVDAKFPSPLFIENMRVLMGLSEGRQFPTCNESAMRVAVVNSDKQYET